MEYEIRIRELIEDEGGGFLAEHPQLKGCMADGESKEEAIRNLESAKVDWIESAKEMGIKIPTPYKEIVFKRVNITLPDDLLNDIDNYAKNHNLSRSELIKNSLEKVVY
jgi:predicted RNase H-like HicB family nuclease